MKEERLEKMWRDGESIWVRSTQIQSDIHYTNESALRHAFSDDI